MVEVGLGAARLGTHLDSVEPEFALCSDRGRQVMNGVSTPASPTLGPVFAGRKFALISPVSPPYTCAGYDHNPR